MSPTKAKGKRPSQRSGQRDLTPGGRPRGRVRARVRVGGAVHFAVKGSGSRGALGLGVRTPDSARGPWGPGPCCTPRRLPQRPAPGLRVSVLRAGAPDSVPLGVAYKWLTFPETCAPTDLSNPTRSSRWVFSEGCSFGWGLCSPNHLSDPGPGAEARPGEAQATAGPGSPGPFAGAQRWAGRPHCPHAPGIWIQEPGSRAEGAGMSLPL